MNNENTFSNQVVDNLGKSSWIRAMFEKGEQLKKIYGNENVFDFTLGNPDPEPSKEVLDTMRTLIDEPNIHKYMANAGYPDVRQKIAEHTQKESGVSLSAKDVIMVNGAAGGLNVVLKSILNPGEEVIVIAPFFSEYKFYTENHGGTIVPVKAKPGSFALDVDNIKNAINKKTKAIILNSPNNPTGAVYDEESLLKLSKVLKNADHTIFVLSDEPYVKIVYDNVKIPSVIKIFDNSIVVNSFSKSLALPGERIGYVIVNPKIDRSDVLVAAIVFANRTLGFVNAPSMLQKVIANHLNDVTGLNEYKEKRDALYNILIESGFECEKPKGAFYLFPKSPIPDDGLFAAEALKYNLVLVGGTGFGYPGYLRLAYCVSMDTIRNSRKSFNELMKNYK